MEEITLGIEDMEEVQSACDLVRIFSGGLAGGMLPPPHDSLEAMLSFWINKIRSMSNSECQWLADAGDIMKMHEFALRMAAGIGEPPSAPKAPNVPLAEQYWTTILHSPNATELEKASAHAYLIRLPLGPGNPPSVRTEDCIRAGTHADLAAMLGLGNAPNVLHLGKTMHYLRNGEHKAVFAMWKHFWGAVDARNAEIQAEMDKKAEKRFVKPSRYQCAGPGCPVKASSGNMLRACAGKCEDAYKPRYCTKECQKADWKTHKPMCKPGIDVQKIETSRPRSTYNPTDRSITMQRFGLGTETTTASKKIKPGSEYSVEIDGVKVQAGADNFTAEEMKEFVAQAKIASAERRGA
ncbi:hypothetical protein R3P38DRAFT_2843380 [Favolaschia claudopus]|uniref:MYND-type domain-containing protein n=1 Tax=Favolaschia claudopus TaxID=2862362 RepID=A0AAW0E272_9AGAR